MIDGPLRDVNIVNVACYENHSAAISGREREREGEESICM